MVVCLERGADLHMAQVMPLPLTVSCFSKIQIGFTFLVRPTRVVPENGPLNGCVSIKQNRYTNKNTKNIKNKTKQCVGSICLSIPSIDRSKGRRAAGLLLGRRYRSTDSGRRRAPTSNGAAVRAAPVNAGSVTFTAAAVG